MGIASRLKLFEGEGSQVSAFRRARARHVMTLIDEVVAARGRCRILDVGGTETYWNNLDPGFLDARGVEITLLNVTEAPVSHARFTSIAGDGCAIGFEDRAFDMVHSNSVIEHVGDWPRVEAFAREVRRVGEAYFVQAPYFWFPVEPHFRAPFFHWMPETVRAGMMMRRAHGFHKKAEDVGAAMKAVQWARLPDRRQFAYLFPDAEMLSETVMGLTKSLMAIRHPA